MDHVTVSRAEHEKYCTQWVSNCTEIEESEQRDTGTDPNIYPLVDLT
jgi:hypothetical protein